MSIELYKPTITDFESEEQLYHFAESFVLDELLENIGEEGSFRMALSGGSTPLPLYQKLGNNSSLPWEEVELYQTDERFVPATEEESNQMHIKQSFGEETFNRIKDVFFMQTGNGLEYSLSHYEEVIDSLDDPYFDLTILGIGTDGHFASLFPHGSYLGHQETHVLATDAGDKYTTRQRISLTPETILNSKKILVLLKGEEKEAVLGEIVGGERKIAEFPAKLLLAHPKVFILSHFPKREESEGETT